MLFSQSGLSAVNALLIAIEIAAQAEIRLLRFGSAFPSGTNDTSGISKLSARRAVSLRPTAFPSDAELRFCFNLHRN